MSTHKTYCRGPPTARCCWSSTPLPRRSHRRQKYQWLYTHKCGDGSGSADVGQPHAPPQHTAHLSLVRSIPFPQVHHGTTPKCSYHATPPPPCDTKSCWSTSAHTLLLASEPPPPRPPWGRVCAALSTSLWLRHITSAAPIRGRGPRLNSCPAAPVRIHFWRGQIHHKCVWARGPGLPTHTRTLSPVSPIRPHCPTGIQGLGKSWRQMHWEAPSS